MSIKMFLQLKTTDCNTGILYGCTNCKSKLLNSLINKF